MAKILCLETATTNCSVALSENGSVIAFKEDNNESYSHAEQLHVFIETVLSEAAVGLQEMDAIAISMGPGSYTGLRIGVSAAKGLCFALDKPLLALPTLQLLALQVENKTDFTVPMLDARRMEVYASVFDPQGHEIRETKAEILDGGSFSEYLSKGQVTFIGSGVEKFQKVCTHPNALFMPNQWPSACTMARLSHDKFLKKDFEDLAYFEPYYLKDFIKTS